MSLEEGIVATVEILQKEAKYGVYPWQVMQKLPDVDNSQWWCERKIRATMKEMAGKGELNRVGSRLPSAKYAKRGYRIEGKRGFG